jgi:hypothetical protein
VVGRVKKEDDKKRSSEMIGGEESTGGESPAYSENEREERDETGGKERLWREQ